jgi:phospholipid/cholesterol/gamma-HCH transport system permease protein
MMSPLARMGRKSHFFFAEVARFSTLVGSFFYWAFAQPSSAGKLARRSFARQLVFAGNESLPIVALVTSVVGAVLALQAAYQLRQFGALLYTGGLVSVSMAREIGPLITAIVLAGRVGASITAELGTMKVQEEIDALTTMGIPPVSFLVLPRVMALAVMVPALTVLGNAFGMLGGFAVGTLGLGLSAGLYIQESFDALVVKDIVTGLVKSFVFALLIGCIASYKGLSVTKGAEGVGRATTGSVVLSIVAIIVADCLFTAVFYYLFP